MKKILALLRVSTNKQDLESQKMDILKYLNKEGYKENEIDWIEAKGASAVKASPEYLRMLERVKESLISNNIKTLVIWHLNRLGRKKKYIQDMINWFVENQIQLICLNPFVKLLNEDFTYSQANDMLFQMFAIMIEVDTSELFEKAKRGKEFKRSIGDFLGGNVLFGYNVKDKKILINEDEAKVVKLIFDLYCIKKYNCYDIAEYLNSKGIKTNQNKEFTNSKVSKILNEKRYLGETKGFPQIILKSIFEKASLRRDTNKFHTKYKNNNIYFGSKLLFSVKDGKAFTMSPQIGDCAYGCNRHNISVNINLIDSLLWFAAKEYRKQRLNSKSEKEKVINKINEEINERNEQINNLNKNNEDLQNSIDKVTKKEIKGDISPKGAENFREEYKRKIKDNKRNIDRLETEVEGLRNDILEIDEVRNERSEELDLIRSDIDKKRIINEEIGRVEIIRLQRGKYGVLIKFGQRIVKSTKYFIIVSTSRYKYIGVPYVVNKEEIKEYNEKLLKGEEVERVEKKYELEILNIKIEERIKKAN